MSGHVTERLETEKKWVCVFVCLHVTRGTLNSSASSAYPHGWSAMQWPNLTQNILFPIYMPHSSTDWKTKSFYPMEIKRKYTKATLKTEGHFMCTFKSFSLLNKEKKPDWGDIKIHFILPFSFFFKFNFFTNLFEKVVAFWLSNNGSFPHVLPMLFHPFVALILLPFCLTIYSRKSFKTNLLIIQLVKINSKDSY